MNIISKGSYNKDFNIQKKVKILLQNISKILNNTNNEIKSKATRYINFIDLKYTFFKKGSKILSMIKESKIKNFLMKSQRRKMIEKSKTMKMHKDEKINKNEKVGNNMILNKITKNIID